MSEFHEQQGVRAFARRDDAHHTARLVARVVAEAAAQTGLAASTTGGAGGLRESLLSEQAAALRYGPPGVPL